MRAAPPFTVDLVALRSAIADIVDTDRYDRWLVTAPDTVLVRLAAPLEMLQFQYYLSPPQERHLVRAAQVCAEAADAGLQGCGDDMVEAFSRLAAALRVDTRSTKPSGPDSG